MLQINTGKLFTSEVGRTNLLRGVLYSNLKFPWQKDIITLAGTLRSTDYNKESNALVYELEERIEKERDGPGVLVSRTIRPFSEDFSAVLSFYFSGIVSPDSEITKSMTNGKAGFSSYGSPRNFINRCFEDEIWVKDNEVEGFIGFIEQLLGLERRYFLGAMKSIKTFVGGLHRVKDDLGLAYTLMVTAIESLTQDFDGYESSWEDVDERKRLPIDKVLESYPSEVSGEIKKAIISVEHTSLARRYRAFVLNHIDDHYFEYTDGITGKRIARYELEPSLKQAYAVRSRYVHSLKSLPDLLTMPHQHGEIVYENRVPVLTLQGLYRLHHCVIKKFVSRCPTTDKEPYNYQLEQAGVVSAQLAPQYWIHKPLIRSSDIRKRLEGFLEQLSSHYAGIPNAVVTDIRELLQEVENTYHKSRKEHKPAMYALYFMFNSLALKEQQLEGFEKFVDRYEKDANLPSVEMLIAFSVLGFPINWSLPIHRKTHDEYFEKRTKPSGVHAPRLFESMISLVLSERYRKEGNVDACCELVRMAMMNNPDHKKLHNYGVNFEGDKEISWREILLSEGNEKSE